MKTADYAFGWLLVVASLMHGAGSVLAYRHKPELLLWAEAATLAGLLLAAINLSSRWQAGRPCPGLGELRGMRGMDSCSCQFRASGREPLRSPCSVP